MSEKDAFFFQKSRDSSNIRAVLFDVYGTLVGSNSGDIGFGKSENSNQLIVNLIEKMGLKWRGKLPKNASYQLHQAIQYDHESAREKGISHPEVDILKIWTQLIFRWTLPEKKPTKSQIEGLATEYETAINPVWKSPGLEEIISFCQKKGLYIGIVSNAQFYTPPMLESFLKKDLTHAGFQPELCLWSYREGLAKPDPSLFHKAANLLKTRFGVRSDSALFVGNDMLNDIWASSQAGFKAVLYDDDHSLLMRSEDERCANLKPFAIVNSLLEIKQFI